MKLTLYIDLLISCSIFVLIYSNKFLLHALRFSIYKYPVSCKNKQTKDNSFFLSCLGSFSFFRLTV